MNNVASTNRPVVECRQLVLRKIEGAGCPLNVRRRLAKVKFYLLGEINAVFGVVCGLTIILLGQSVLTEDQPHKVSLEDLKCLIHEHLV